MNVGQLRDLLNGVPDDVPVYVASGAAELPLQNVYRAGAAARSLAFADKYGESFVPVNPTQTWITPCFIIRLTP